MANTVEPVAWQQFLERYRKAWRQGEHVSMIGPTGSGKTTLALALLDMRAYVVALATKPRDDTMNKLVKAAGWRKITAWPPPPSLRGGQKVVLWPRFVRPEDMRAQAIELDHALREMFVQGSWTIFADELYYLCHQLKLTGLLEMIWTQGRSMDLTLVGGTQRPAHVPLLAYDQATHLFFWRDNDETNLRRIGGLGGLNSNLIRATVAQLPKHHFLYVNTRTGELLTAKAER